MYYLAIVYLFILNVSFFTASATERGCRKPQVQMHRVWKSFQIQASPEGTPPHSQWWVLLLLLTGLAGQASVCLHFGMYSNDWTARNSKIDSAPFWPRVCK